MTRVSIVIVSYNTAALLDQCLESIARCESRLDLDVVVIDNGSRDGSADLVAERHPGVRLIRNAQNLGFSKASNQGMRLSEAEYVLLLNSDTVVLPGAIDRVVEYLEANPEVGVAGCKVLKPDGTLDLPCRRSFPTPENSFYQRVGLTKLFPQSRRFAAYYLSYLDPDEVALIDCVMGAYMMIRRAVIDQIGLLDEGYFFYAEDIDYCYRTKQAGWQVAYYPRATIIHHRGASTARDRRRATTYFHHSMLVFYRKHHAPYRNRLINGLVYSGMALSYAAALVWNTITRARQARPLTNLREFVGRGDSGVTRPHRSLGSASGGQAPVVPAIPAQEAPRSESSALLPRSTILGRGDARVASPQGTPSEGVARPDDADRTLVG